MWSGHPGRRRLDQETMQQVSKKIVGGEQVRTKPAMPAKDIADALAPPFLAFGLVVTAVGIIDLGIAWWPLRFGVGEWEFGMASRTFNSLALGTTGFIFLVVAVSARRSVWGLRAVAALATVAFLGLLMIAALFALNVPVALGAVEALVRPSLETAILRTSCFAVLYIALYGWLSWFTWRRSGVEKREALV